MLHCQFCIYPSEGPVIIRNQSNLKSIYKNPFKDSHSHLIHSCFPTIASNGADKLILWLCFIFTYFLTFLFSSRLCNLFYCYKNVHFLPVISFYIITNYLLIRLISSAEFPPFDLLPESSFLMFSASLTSHLKRSKC